MRYTFKAKLWVWPGGTSAWKFVTVPKDISQTIQKKIKLKRGFGSVRVEAKTGKTKWLTSIFPDSKSGTYVLPIKSSVRRAEQIEDGDTLKVQIDTKR